MILKRIFNSDFSKVFTGTIILDTDIEDKLDSKHKVYKDDLADALGDPYFVVMRAKQKSPASQVRLSSNGKVYEILAQTESGKILFIIGRLFPDGNLYIITSYWADHNMENIYFQESEALRND